MSTYSPIELPTTAEEVQAIQAQVENILISAADAIVALPSNERTIESTLFRFQEAQSKAAALQTLCTFPSLVHLDKSVRDASNEAKKSLQQAWSNLHSRRDVYEVLKALDNGTAYSPTTARLLQATLKLFERHGSGLSADKQRELMQLRAEIGRLELEFQKGLNEDTSEVLLTRAELEGCMDSWIDGLTKVTGASGEGDSNAVLYKVTMKTPDILNVMKNATLPQTRKRVSTAYREVCGRTNGPIIEQLIKCRYDAAQLLGYPNHAAYQLDNNMAKTVETVKQFIDNILKSIKDKLESDKKVLLELKKKEYDERGWSSDFDGKLYTWDIKYYQEILFREQYAVDHTALQVYFPLDYVREQVMGIYSKIFGLRFQQVPGKYWADDVMLYAVYDQRAQDEAEKEQHQQQDPEEFKIGYFYLDLHPRAGKYAHQCVVPLRPSYVDSQKSGQNGEHHSKQVLPIAVNVGNLSRGTPNNPAMLKHAEVRTFFHEFGHVCHALSNKCQFSIFNFSWSAVPYPTKLAMDFLEVPSIMLENWLWEPEVLKRLSRHHKTGEQLPDDIIQALVRTRKVSAGLNFTQQIAMTAIDQKLHTLNPYEEKRSVPTIWKEMYEEIVGVSGEEGEDVNQVAQWYHFAMGGYDACYYVYAWSEMHAHDLYTRFKGPEQSESRALDSQLGREYWEKILVPGATTDAIELLKDFLGREPSPEAFQRYLTEP
ncbi:Thimet oligopeptidase [Actinomortierella wolfii]|nr:Thimet oligopeptidase [Actinomortierella wolfii]